MTHDSRVPSRWQLATAIQIAGIAGLAIGVGLKILPSAILGGVAIIGAAGWHYRILRSGHGEDDQTEE